jgi:hypothetical protein
MASMADRIPELAYLSQVLDIANESRHARLPVLSRET